MGWIGVDLDGVLALEGIDGKGFPGSVGDPILPMINQVKQWLAEGKEVRIFTARMDERIGAQKRAKQVEMITTWLTNQGLPALHITNVKDLDMECLFDDRCRQVERNTGRML